MNEYLNSPHQEKESESQYILPYLRKIKKENHHYLYMHSKCLNSPHQEKSLSLNIFFPIPKKEKENHQYLYMLSNFIMHWWTLVYMIHTFYQTPHGHVNIQSTTPTKTYYKPTLTFLRECNKNPFVTYHSLEG